MLRFVPATCSAVALSLALIAVPAAAQEANSGSNSSAGANSGSVSGAASNQTQGQQANNAGIGNSTSTSASGSTSGSESTSGSASASDQGQMQTQGQTASNMQGVSVSNTFNSSQRKVTEIRTNAAVPLAASSSFSSDFCGSTASAGASVAPLGISLSGAAPVFDESCRALRRSEKFGMAAMNAANLGHPELADRLLGMMIWSICNSDGGKPDAAKPTATACEAAGMNQPIEARAPVVAPVPAPSGPVYESHPVIQDPKASTKSKDDDKYGNLGELGANEQRAGALAAATH